MSNFLTPDALMESLSGAYEDTMSVVLFDRKIWYARTNDDEACAILASATGAAQNALRVNKYLFDGTDNHRALMSASNAAYSTHKNCTKTLGNVKLRVVPNGGIQDYITTVDPMIEAHNRALATFEAGYVNDCSAGLQHLGTLGSAARSLYPSRESLADKFAISYDIVPMPSKEGYGNIDAATLTRLQINLEKNMRARVALVFDGALKEFAAALDTAIVRIERKNACMQDDTLPKSHLTSAVLTAPITIARTLRRFAAGDWAEKMAKVEVALDKALAVPKLGQDPEAMERARELMVFIRSKL